MLPTEVEVPIEPPSATTTTTIGISATSPTFTSAFGKKRASLTTVPSTGRKNKKKLKETPSGVSEPIILQDAQVSFAQQKADKNKINGEPRGGGQPGGNSDSDNLDSADCNSESSSGSGSKSQELSDVPSSFSSSSSSSSSSFAPSGPTKMQSPPEKHQGLTQQTSREEKVTPSKQK